MGRIFISAARAARGCLNAIRRSISCRTKGDWHMEFSGTQTIAAPIENVWAFLLDVNNVASCAPGFQSLEVLEEEHWKAVVAVGVGAEKAKFTQDTTRPEKEEPPHMTMKGRGKAPGSAVDLFGDRHLPPLEGGETSMDWKADYVFSGPIPTLWPG